MREREIFDFARLKEIETIFLSLLTMKFLIALICFALCVSTNARDAESVMQLVREGAKGMLSMSVPSTSSKNTTEGEGCPLVNGMVCNNQGQCTRNGTCECNMQYTGERCEQKLNCGGDLNNCNGHGECAADRFSGHGTCYCHPGWDGTDCSQKACPENCNDHGICNGGICTCNNGWDGESCSLQKCPLGKNDMQCSARGREFKSYGKCQQECTQNCADQLKSTGDLPDAGAKPEKNRKEQVSKSDFFGHDRKTASEPDAEASALLELNRQVRRLRSRK